MWPVLICAIVGWAFAVFVKIEGRKEVADQRIWFQDELSAARDREQQLLDQCQLNSQHLPYYPQVGPFEAPEEKTYLHSDDGLISFEDIDIDAVVAEAMAE